MTKLPLLPAGSAPDAVPIHLIRDEAELSTLEGLSASQKAFAAASGFKGEARRILVLPEKDGALGAVLVGLGPDGAPDPGFPPEVALGAAAQVLPAGTYRLATKVASPGLAALAYVLGGSRFGAYKSDATSRDANLEVPDGVDRAEVEAIARAVIMARDLINAPSNDMMPTDLEAAARRLAESHGAEVRSVVGEELLKENFPLIHAVGRASSCPPRLVDITWSPKGSAGDLPKYTVIGKGITFDTGGLDLKPASGMLLMKKDMGGAASALAIADMIMSARLPCRLRVILSIAENAVSGSSFRPGDVIRSRSGRTVEIGNTDAEGRLVLADALSLADEDSPDLIFTLATLTGAARVALGPDLPALFTNDDALASELSATGNAIGDPVWRLPFWPGYQRLLDSDVADFNNVSETPFGGAVVAALFLKRFVTRTKSYAHFDMLAWRPQARPLGPKGGEAHCARLVFEVLKRRLGSNRARPA